MVCGVYILVWLRTVCDSEWEGYYNSLRRYSRGSEGSVSQILFPAECQFFQDDKSPIPTTKIVQICFEENNKEVEHLVCPLPPLSPNLKFCGNICIPTPSAFLELGTAFQEEWLHITYCL